MNEEQLKQDLTKWIDEQDDRRELYGAYIAGVNVGLEAEQSNRVDDMIPDEFSEWLREMYEARLED